MAKAKKATAKNKAVSSKKTAPKKAPGKAIKLGGVPNQGNKITR